MVTTWRACAVLARAAVLVGGLALIAAATGCGSPSPTARPAVGPATRVSPGPTRARPARATVVAAPVRCPAPTYGAHTYAPQTAAKTVALTFDDGPGRSTDAILAILKRYRVPATFFNIGAAMATRPYLVQDEVRDGFAMGNHSYDHPHLTTLPAVTQNAELARANAEQRSIAGTVPCAFRPPYGEYDATTLELAQENRLSVWLWSTDTLDWEANGSGSSYWVQTIIERAEQGSTLLHPILLMHNARAGDPATVTALPTIIEYYRLHGYQFVAL
jgi:peptidoglycan/xylan/chitin deacetylase (PgdA/CDA1 family)